MIKLTMEAPETNLDDTTAIQAMNKIIMEDDVAADRLVKMQAYAANLHRKHPTMSQARVMRKTAEYFRVKLITK